MSDRQNLSDFIAEELKNKIMTGKYKSGEQIPNEFDIAKEYNVSRFTVREAIKKICTTGLVKIERGRGTYVNTMSPSSFMKPLLPMLILDEKDLKEICEARIAIERQTAYLSAIDPDAVITDKLNDLIEHMEKCLLNNDFDGYNDLDLEYHLKIAEASKNQILYIMLQTIHELLKVEIQRVSKAPNANENSIKRHRLIVEKIRNKQPEAAAKLMEEHIHDAIDYFDHLIINKTGEGV